MVNKQFCNFIYSSRRVSKTGYGNFFPNQGVGVIYTFYLLFQIEILANIFSILISNPWFFHHMLKHCH